MKLSETNLRELYRSWHESAGIFRSFVRASGFVSLQQHKDFNYDLHLDNLRDENERLAELVSCIKDIAENKKGKQLFFIDMPGTLSMRVGLELNRKSDFIPALISNALLHDEGLVGTEEYKQNLLRYGQYLHQGAKGPAAFLLDYNRYGEYEEEDYITHFNNQYELNEEDLPSVEMLHEIGCRSVNVFTTAPMKEDLVQYIDYLKNKEIEVTITEVGEQ